MKLTLTVLFLCSFQAMSATQNKPSFILLSDVASADDVEAQEDAAEAAIVEKIRKRSDWYMPPFVVTIEDLKRDIEDYVVLDIELDGDEMVEIHGRTYKDEDVEDKIQFYKDQIQYQEETGTVLLVETSGVKAYASRDSPEAEEVIAAQLQRPYI
ncbi:unnamed protein product [Blepharisma stoltei]|uniref:Uncharacterized protein n=1 Tax=Blepharisma stoltei TaxID=1481888 RepID=A0AAU9IYU7_9CILI|nr:unnamed protein product [Blepharisma stoltei]CAG9316470.1 unnamed protein product [Blepharisma stoltei]